MIKCYNCKRDNPRGATSCIHCKTTFVSGGGTSSGGLAATPPRSPSPIPKIATPYVPPVAPAPKPATPRPIPTPPTAPAGPIGTGNPLSPIGATPPHASPPRTCSLNYVEGIVTNVQMAQYPKPTNWYLVGVKVIVSIITFFFKFLVVLFRPSYIFGMFSGGRFGQPREYINIITLQVRDASSQIWPVSIHNPNAATVNVSDEIIADGRPFQATCRARQVRIVSTFDPTIGHRITSNIIITGN